MNPIAAYRSLQDDLMHDKVLGQFNLSLPVRATLKICTTVHWVWWLHRKKKLCTQQTIVPAALGTLTDFALKFTPTFIENTIRGIAKLILLATRIDECFQRIRALSNAFNELKEAIKGNYSPLIEPQWAKNPDSMFFSIKARNQAKSRIKNLEAYWCRLYYCTLNVLAKTFNLSMQLWDTYHAFIYSHDDVPEMYVNGIAWYKKLRKNKAYLGAKLEQYQPVIQKVFDLVKADITAEDLIKSTKSIGVKVIDTVDKLEQTATLAGEAIVTASKKTASTVIEIKSKLLCQGLVKPSIHTPFILNKRPRLFWPDKMLLKRKM
ncbi:hypothetical protein DB42_EA00550 [Neochlamydia sp. EPS4]|uniref:hypothetical protein n=1 Tax=Neochlamydia sp. EPS4 TaxID=1478175 RepID=UPI000582A2FB|nr:hypothetical protein [Neochlamydia sp. EPS4]KIC76183.1 hypothetical protein DB42_EA00550 [Neochlamydia sp. EPS4]